MITSIHDRENLNFFSRLAGFSYRSNEQLGSEGKTILMATHDIFNAVNVGRHIGIMKSGVLIHTLRTADITANELQKLYLETI